MLTDPSNCVLHSKVADRYCCMCCTKVCPQCSCNRIHITIDKALSKKARELIAANPFISPTEPSPLLSQLTNLLPSELNNDQKTQILLNLLTVCLKSNAKTLCRIQHNQIKALTYNLRDLHSIKLPPTLYDPQMQPLHKLTQLKQQFILLLKSEVEHINEKLQDISTKLNLISITQPNNSIKKCASYLTKKLFDSQPDFFKNYEASFANVDSNISSLLECKAMNAAHMQNQICGNIKNNLLKRAIKAKIFTSSDKLAKAIVETTIKNDNPISFYSPVYYSTIQHKLAGTLQKYTNAVPISEKQITSININSIFKQAYYAYIDQCSPTDYTVFTLSHSMRLDEWIGHPCVYKLIYRATKDGHSSFHSLCDNIGPTLSIIKTEFDKIIGCYTEVPWDTTGQIKDDLKLSSFIFSMDLDKVYRKTNTVDANNCKAGVGPWMGCGNLLKIVENCLVECSSAFESSCTAYEAYGGELIGGAKTFKVKDYEVFKVDRKK